MIQLTFHFAERDLTISISDTEAKKILDELVLMPLQAVPSKITPSIPPLSHNSAGSVKHLPLPPLPSRKDVKDYIISQPNYRHSVESLVEHLIGRKISSDEGENSVRWINGVRSTINRVRKEIENKEKGNWVSERRDRQKVFEFVREATNANDNVM